MGSRGYNRGYEAGSAPEPTKDPSAYPVKPPSSGGQGAPVDPHHLRADIRMLIQGVTRRWVNDPAKILAIAERLEHTAIECDDVRASNAAAEGVRKLLELGQRVAEFDDKTGRLDSGQTTENQGIHVTYGEGGDPWSP